MANLLREYGAPDDLVNAWRQPDEFGVWPENMPVLNLFTRCKTQWRTGAMGGFLGLDYVAVDVVIKYSDIDATPELFADLQAMESVALSEFNKK